MRHGSIRSPVLVIAGRGDRLFSFGYTRRVFDRIVAPPSSCWCSTSTGTQHDPPFGGFMPQGAWPVQWPQPAHQRDPLQPLGDPAGTRQRVWPAAVPHGA